MITQVSGGFSNQVHPFWASAQVAEEMHLEHWLAQHLLVVVGAVDGVHWLAQHLLVVVGPVDGVYRLAQHLLVAVEPVALKPEALQQHYWYHHQIYQERQGSSKMEQQEQVQVQESVLQQELHFVSLQAAKQHYLNHRRLYQELQEDLQVEPLEDLQLE